jgi:indole-3-glycerol phosphate synthase
MAAGYGADAVSGLAKADWFKGALSSLKALAKSDEAIVNTYPAIKSLVA